MNTDNFEETNFLFRQIIFRIINSVEIQFL